MKLTRTNTQLDATPVKAMISVHGTVAQPEYPDLIEETSRKGWGVTFWGKEGTENWFHLPLCVHNVMDNAAPKLARVFLFFHNTSRSPITSVHLYDGPKLLKSFEDLKLFGDHARTPDRLNTFRLSSPTELSHGLGISVSVDFPEATGEKAPHWILFTSAMAEFRT
jgi:hypothetical protein